MGRIYWTGQGWDGGVDGNGQHIRSAVIGSLGKAGGVKRLLSLLSSVLQGEEIIYVSAAK